MAKPSPLQGHIRALKTRIIRALLGFDANDVVRALSQLGVKQGDTIMVHSGFGSAGAYTGTIPQLAEAFISAVGPNGTVAMQTMAYYGMRSADYLASGKPFDVRHSVSMMGIISEVFRRRPDVRRSLHPTHPIATWGSRGEWLVAGQGKELAPFGELSPFARLLEADGKLVMFDASVASMTFVCHVEHLCQDCLPVPLYELEPRTGIVLDYEGVGHRIETLVMSKEIAQARNIKRLESALLENGVLASKPMGRGRLMVGTAQAIFAQTENFLRQHGGFHDNPIGHCSPEI